jgi:hypothetical protein
MRLEKHSRSIARRGAVAMGLFVHELSGASFWLTLAPTGIAS